MATLTLRNVPDDLVARLKERAKGHRRSLNSETIAALELADAAAGGGTPPSGGQPLASGGHLEAHGRGPRWSSGRRQRGRARHPAASLAAPAHPRGGEAQLDRFAELLSRFKGPLTSEEIIAAIERESHPPERQLLAGAEGSPP